MELRLPINVAAFTTAALATVLIASDQGGYFQRTWPWAGLGLAAAGALALRAVDDLRLTRASLILIGATAAICVWTLASWLWSSEPSTTLDEAQRAPIYLAAAVTFVVLASAGGSAGIMLGVAAGTTAIAGFSLVDRQVVPAQGRLLAGPLGYANALGALCAIGLVVVAALGARHRSMLAVPPAAILVTALALTSSRGSWLALGAGGLVAAAAGSRFARRAALLVATAFGALFVLTAFTIPTRLLQARADYWHAAWHVGLRHPLAGTGAGTYDLAWAAFGDVGRWGGALDAHNVYLETFAELGLVGILLLVVALAAPVVAGLRAAPTAAGVAAVAGAVAFLVHAGLDWDWELPAVTTVGLACLAAAAVADPARPATAPRLKTTLLVLEGAVIVLYSSCLLSRMF